jgi:RNA polymerase sigma-70 factor, ECF subfamily
MNAQAAIGVKNLQHWHQCSSENVVSEDRLLVAEAKSGNASAFGALYERHRARIYRATFHILRNQQDAEDAVQLSFQHAFTSLLRFREHSSFSTWMTRIAINEALMLVRKKRLSKVLLEKDSSDTEAHRPVDLADRQPTPEQALAQTELRCAVVRAISRLRPRLRIVVLLREVQGLTSAETARRLGLTISAVKARTYHANRHLRRYLERKFEGARAAFTRGTRN